MVCASGCTALGPEHRHARTDAGEEDEEDEGPPELEGHGSGEVDDTPTRAESVGGAARHWDALLRPHWQRLQAEEEEAAARGAEDAGGRAPEDRGGGGGGAGAGPGPPRRAAEPLALRCASRPHAGSPCAPARSERGWGSLQPLPLHATCPDRSGAQCPR